jgi:D-arabinose 1-dehydrogenase-like Zn-dependent alcohol dehydrogenase
MKRYALVEFGQPLQEIESPDPIPTGTEVLVRVRRSGVCHSDLHIADGYFDMGEGKKMDVGPRMTLPQALGHEILGEVIAAGPEAPNAPIGKTMLVHPWIGCGDCRACDEERENECSNMNSLGIFRDGGYATHVLVDHPKFLVDVDGLDLDQVTPLACSGVTVYNALRTALPVQNDEWLCVMGAGGLGLNAVSIARALGAENIVSIDLDDNALAAAEDMGAKATINPSNTTDVIKSLQQVADNRLTAVVDTVGNEVTSHTAVQALVKTGRYVLVGLHGGTFKMPLPMLPQKSLTVKGSYVGSCKDLRELIALVRAGKVESIPVSSRPLDQANATLQDLRDGKITGRVVLTTDA